MKVDLRNGFEQRKIAKEFRLKARNARKKAREFELRATIALKKDRRNLRLEKKYDILHRRAVDLYNARLHRKRYRVHRLKRKQFLKRAHHNKRRARFYHNSAVKQLKEAKFNARAALRLSGRISNIRKEIAKLELKIKHLEKLVLLHRRKAVVHRRNAVKDNAKAKRHRRAEREFLHLASEERIKALKQKREWKKWISQWRSTFTHRRK